MTEAPGLLVKQLQPEQIGGLFGRSGTLAESSFLERFTPKYRFTIIGLAIAVILVILAIIDDSLIGPRNIPTVLRVLIDPVKHPAHVSLALLQDPVAIIAIAMTLATPVLCAEQITAIKGFNAMNERNISYRAHLLNIHEIDKHVAHANATFIKVGSRKFSIFLAAGSLILSFLIDLLIHYWQLLAGWNPTSLSSSSWRREVYDGWWANPREHLLMAIAFWLVGGYFFYFLNKQLRMGLAFALYARRVMPLGFGVSPNMRTNTDGYWGLRLLRHFMQTTYGSTLGHLIMVLGILIFWLPFGGFTLLMIIAVMIINASVVIYPSVLASAGSVQEKKKYVAFVARSRRSKADRDAMIDKVWATPNLPFHLRSTFTAATLYLLIPLLLAVVPALLHK